MSAKSYEVLSEALKLSPVERAELVEKILSSFEFPDRKKIDELWANEVEDRIEAYERGDISSASARKVFEDIEGSKKRVKYL